MTNIIYSYVGRIYSVFIAYTNPGKVVCRSFPVVFVRIDFSVFQSPAGSPHNLMLRELYNEYAKQGLEIYQVSLDADEHYWKTAADNLPWVCVRDGNGVYSTNVAVYNVRQVPSIFLINRNNELKLRGEDIKDLEAAVKSLL